MGHTKGYNRRARDKFTKPFRANGAIKISNYLTTYKVGDYVDIRVDGAIHKGMPHKYYHGRTGRVFNINPRSVGVIVNKPIKQRQIAKRLHVRIEHVRLSNCRKAFVLRQKENDKVKHEAKLAGKRVSTKRQPEGPRAAHMVKVEKVTFQNPQKYKDLC